MKEQNIYFIEFCYSLFCFWIFFFWTDACARDSSVCLYESHSFFSVRCVFMGLECVRVCVFVMINVRYPLARWCWTRPIHQHWKDQWAESWQSTLSRANAPMDTHKHTHVDKLYKQDRRLRLRSPLGCSENKCCVFKWMVLLVLWLCLSYISSFSLVITKMLVWHQDFNWMMFRY